MLRLTIKNGGGVLETVSTNKQERGQGYSSCLLIKRGGVSCLDSMTRDVYVY